jgi:hypothetical protein
VKLIVSPVTALATEALFMSERSALAGAGGCGAGGAVTPTVAVALLLAAFESAVELVTEAVIVAEPVEPGSVSVRLIAGALAPEASVPVSEQATSVAEATQLQPLPEAETKMKPAGIEIRA